MPIYTNNKFSKNNNNSSKQYKVGLSLVVIFSLLLILIATNLIHPLTNFFLGTFGIFSYVLFLILIAYGAILMLNKKSNLSIKSTIFLILSFVTILCLLQLATTAKLNTNSFSEFLVDCYNSKMTAGGLLCGILVYPVIYLTHAVASYIVFAIILTIFVSLSIVSIASDFANNEILKNAKITTKQQTKTKQQNSYLENTNNAVENSVNINEDYEEDYSSNETEEKDDSIFISDDEVDESKTDKEIEIETIKQINKEKAKAILWPDKVKADSYYSKTEEEKPLSPKEILFSNNSLYNEKTNHVGLDENADYSSYISGFKQSKPQMFVHSTDNNLNDNNIITQKQKTKRELTENERKNLEFLRATKGQFELKDKTVVNDDSENNNDDDLFNNNQNYSNELYKAVDEYNNSLNNNLYDETLTKKNFKEKYYNSNYELDDEETETGLTNLSGYTNRTVSDSLLNDDKTNETFFENNFRNVKDLTIKQENRTSQQTKQTEEVKQPKKPKPHKPYVAPPTSLLNYIPPKDDEIEDYSDKAALLEQTLESFKIPAKVVSIVKGPAVTRFELALPANLGISVKRVTSFADDIAMVLRAQGSIRIETPIPGKNAFGVEVPNKKISTVALRDVFESEAFKKSKSPLTIGLGKNITNECVTARTEKMPHLLVAGTTGSGKSVCLNVMLMSWLFKASPDELKLILIDPKQVEFSLYNGLPHLLIPNVITDINKAVCALTWAIDEMERRFTLFSNTRVRNIEEYNDRDEVKRGIEQKMPFIAIIVDEYGDIMSQNKKDVEDKIIRIAQKARAAGIHLIIATQRPSVDVITGIIKNNLPSRMAFKVSSYQDSRTILDRGGAENLLGYGDMLFMANGAPDPVRIQCAFVDKDEVERVVEYIKQNNECDFDSEIEDQMFNKKQGGFDAGSGNEEEFDPLLKDALRAVIRSKSVSISKIQRMFGVGFPKAGRIVDQMERYGFISPADSKNQREIYITEQEFEERFGEEF